MCEPWRGRRIVTCLECPTVIREDVHLPPLASVFQKLQDVDFFHSPFSAKTSAQAEVFRVGESLERENMIYCTLYVFMYT